MIEIGLAQVGGPIIILDKGGFGAANARGQNAYLYESEDDVLTVAVAIGFSIFRHRHPLADGNKRAGLISIRAVLGVNDLMLDISAAGPEKIDHLIKSAAGGTLSELALVEALKPFVHER